MAGLMKTARLFLVLAALMTLASVASAGGPAPTLVPTQYPAAQGWNGPWGSYRDSCRDIRDNGMRISAACQRANGSWNNTSLDYRGCRGQIVNDNGNLRCGSSGSWQGAGDWQNGMPRGEYMQTCRDARMNGDDLVARCQRRNGTWNYTRLDRAYQCRGGVFNDDGNLRCGGDRGWHGNDRDRDRDQGRWQGGGGVPRGEYLRTCQNARMNGDRLEANCQRQNGSWHETSFDNPGSCSAIINDNGDLQCGSNNGGGGFLGGLLGQKRQGGVPRGQYLRSCRNAQMNGDRLEANCQRRNGSWHDTSFDNAYNCRNLVNDDGNLQCR